MFDRRLPLVLVVLAVTLSGCTHPADPSGPTLSVIDAQAPESYNALYDAAAETLRRESFRLDRQDRTNGVITTVPETSASWFELWRRQPEPGYYWWESNLSTIQRKATVRLNSTSQPGSYEVDVEVQRLRFSLPERQVDNAAAAVRLYSDAAPTREGRLESASRTGTWIVLGRDQTMEERLLEKILTRWPDTPIVTTQPACIEETVAP
jgi:hypothetical protein